MSFLTNFIITLDFKSSLIEFGDKALTSNLETSWIQMNRCSDGRYSIDARVNDVLLPLLIDTGNSSSISLRATDWPKIFSHSPANRQSLNASIGGESITTRSRRVETTIIGGVNYENLIASELPSRKAVGSLGLAFLRQHRIKLDFANAKMKLERQTLNEEKSDMSGLHLLRLAGKTIVHSVDPDSPAATAGIKEDDVLLKIENAVAPSMRMAEIRKLFQSEEGRKITISVERRGEISEAVIVLEKLL